MNYCKGDPVLYRGERWKFVGVNPLGGVWIALDRSESEGGGLYRCVCEREISPLDQTHED